MLLINALTSMLWISSCTKEGDYSKYLDKAEKIYPGRPDSIIVGGGYSRVQINTLLSADPRMVKMRVYWNNKKDSIEAQIGSADLSKRKKVDISVIPEGYYTFQVVTFDVKGNRSVASEKNGQVYGPNYTQGLPNRVIKSSTIVSGERNITWFSETDKESAIKGVKVTYPKIGGDSITVFTTKLNDVTVFTKGLTNGKFSYKTAYLPKDAIDTLYAPVIVLNY